MIGVGIGYSQIPLTQATDISTGKGLGMTAKTCYDLVNYGPDRLVDGLIVFEEGAYASAMGTFPSQVGDEWVQIDLGQLYTINRIRWISGRVATQITPKDYTMLISATGLFAGEEKTVVTATGVVVDGTNYNQWIEHNVPLTVGRYVRMAITKTQSSDYVEFAEWQVYGF